MYALAENIYSLCLTRLSIAINTTPQQEYILCLNFIAQYTILNDFIKFNIAEYLVKVLFSYVKKKRKIKIKNSL